MRRIGVQYLDIEMAQIDIFIEKWREDVVALNFSILQEWRNANPRSGSCRKLHQLLSSASKEGLIKRDFFEFIIEGGCIVI